MTVHATGTPYICRRWRWAFGPFETVSGESHSKRIRYTKQAEKLENAIQRCVHNSTRLLERNIYYIISSISFVAIPNELEMATMQKVKTDALF